MPRRCVSIPGGGILCGVLVKDCSTPNCGRRSVAQCDYPLTLDPLRAHLRTRGTCSRHMCERCRAKVGDNIDVCPAHSKLPFPGGVQLPLEPKP